MVSLAARPGDSAGINALSEIAGNHAGAQFARLTLKSWPPIEAFGGDGEKAVGRSGLAAQAFAQIAHDIRERQVARLFLAAAFVFDRAFVEALVADDEAMRDPY